VVSPTVTPLTTTTFTELVTDTAAGSATSSVTVMVSPNPGSAGADQYLDPGATTQLGPDPVDGGTYGWTCNRTNCSLTSTTASKPIASPLFSTLYSLAAQSSLTCSVNSTATIWVNLEPQTVPVDGDIAFPVSSKLQVMFDQPMLAGSLTTSTVLLNDAVTLAAIPITLAYDATTRILTITPPAAGANGYVASNDYTLTLTGGTSGVRSNDPILPNVLPNDLLVDFTTAAADATAPGLSSRSPGVGATGVAPNTAVVGTFDEAVDPSTVSGTTVKLAAGATSVTATVTYDFATRTFTLRPSAQLAFSTVYTVTVVGVADLSGNTSNITWTFTTSSAPDTTPPTVTAVNPANAATSVLSSTTVQLTFSEAIDTTTLTGITLTNLTLGTITVGTVTYDPLTNIATFTPSSALTGATQYRVNVSGVKDLAGNAMAAPFTSTFTTRLTLFTDNFESGTGKWNLPTANGGPWSLATNQFRSATHSLTDSAGGKYQANSNSTAELKTPLSVTGLSSVSLQFALRLRSEKNKDYFFVDYRVDGGAWTPINRPNTNNGWQGSVAWQVFTVPIALSGNNTLEFRFRLSTNQNRNFDGAYVDDVLVQSP
jgi:hypothetical protein